MAEATYKFNGFQKQVTMKVVIVPTRRFIIRRWLALQLVKLAAWLLDCDMEINS